MNQLKNYIFFFTMMSCSHETEMIFTPQTSAFDLKQDYLDFSNKMEDGDSLMLFASLSICTSWHYEENIIYKRDGDVWIYSNNEGEFVDAIETTLPEVKYHMTKKDSLSFESLLGGFEDDRIIYTGNVFGMITLIHKKDSIHFNTKGLGEHAKMINYYERIKEKLYPDVELYKPMMIPQMPPEI